MLLRLVGGGKSPLPICQSNRLTRQMQSTNGFVSNCNAWPRRIHQWWRSRRSKIRSLVDDLVLVVVVVGVIVADVAVAFVIVIDLRVTILIAATAHVDVSWHDASSLQRRTA